MASIDKAAIVFSIAIALVAVAIAAAGSAVDNSPAAPTQQMSSAMNTDAAEKAEAAAAKAAAAEKAEAAAVGPETHIVEPAQGSGSPGCETSNACYLPADITINVGDTVQWINSDIAPHTMTSGILKEGGPDGVFDSGLKMQDTTFEFTFNDAGTYGYFCQVHPWMTGTVTVN